MNTKAKLPRFFPIKWALICAPLRLVLMIAGVTALFAQAQDLPTVRIGTIQDGPWERGGIIRTQFETEIRTLLARDFAVSFPEEAQLLADWTTDGVGAALTTLMTDDEVDVVIAMGPVSSQLASRLDAYPKPVLAPFVIDPQLQGIPVDQGASGRPNLSFTVVGGQASAELLVFRQIIDFHHLTVLVSDGLYRALPEHANRLREAAGADTTVDIVPVTDSVGDALAAIAAETDAVYVTPLLQLSSNDFQQLIQGLKDLRLPSFSLWGRAEVEQGLLAGLALDLDYPRLARRTALNLQRILLGGDAAELPVTFPRSQRLTINMATARATGVHLSFALMTEAELLQEERNDLSREVSLAGAVREAADVNLDIAAGKQKVASGVESVRRAQASLGLQALVSGNSTVIDGDRAQASFGSAGRVNSVGSAAIRRVLLSEPLRAKRDIEGFLQEGREAEQDQLRLDVELDAAVAYLNILRTKTVERVQKTNLGTTRTHLELARARQAIGSSGPQDVYRWENQIAVNRRDVIDAIAVRNQAEIALNRLLNRDLEEPFATKEAGLDDPELALSFERLSPYVENMEAFRLFREFMVREAVANAPELHQIDAGLRAQDRTLLASKRSYYLPEISAQADISAISRTGAGSTLQLGALPPGLSIPTPGNVNWNLSVQVSLPLFTSGARKAEVRKSELDLANSRTQRSATEQKVDQRTRSALHLAGASYAGIALTRDAANAARNNLELVRDAYSQGLANTITLLDAQNVALQADLAAANAIYEFLLDLMQVERSIGRFDFFLNREQVNDLLIRLDAYFSEQGYRVAR